MLCLTDNKEVCFTITQFFQVLKLGGREDDKNIVLR